MASKKKGISAGTTWAASSLASTRKYNGWSKEGYERYNTLYQRVKKDRQEQGAAFDLQVQLYDEEQGKASREDDKNVEDYVLPFTMNDFDDESDKNASVAPGRLAVAEEAFSSREATQQSSAGAASYSV